MILYIMATPLTVDLFGTLSYALPRQKLGIGKYPTVADMKVPAKDITSIKVPAGLIATLYSGPNYTGQKLVLSGPMFIPDLRVNKFVAPAAGDWNDALSSMIVEASSSTGSISGYANQAKDWFMANMWLAIGLILLVIVAIYFAFFNDSPEYATM